MFRYTPTTILRRAWLATGTVFLALGLPLGGCSRGGSAEPDAGGSAPDLADSRHDLAVTDQGAPLDLSGSPACPAPCWLNPLPQGNSLRALWRDASGDGWAVGNGPSLVRLEGGRARLVRTAFSEKNDYYSGVWGLSQSDVWVVGSNVALHYDGTSWAQSPVDTGSALSLSAVWGSAPTDVWTVGNNGMIRRYNGTSWQTIPSGTTKGLGSIHGTSDKNIFAVGETGTVLRYDGTTWRPAPLLTGSTLTRVRCAAANDCLAVGEQAAVLHWDGTQWTVVKTTGVLYGTISGLVALGPGSYLLTGYSVGGSYAYHYDGKTLTAAVTDGVELSDVAGPRADDLTAVGGASIAHWNGLSWTRLGTGSTEGLAAIWAASASEVWIAGNGSGSGGHLIRWDGTTFMPYEAPARTTYKALWGSSASAVWAVGYAGGIARWDGTHWSAEPKVTADDLYAIAGSGPTQIFASAGSVLWRYDGTTWTALPSLGSSSVLGLWLASASDGWAVGASSTDKGVLWRFDGSKWTAWPLQFDRPFNVVWGSSANDVWAGGDKGQLAHFDGTTWTLVTSPSTADISVLRGSGPTNVWLSPFGGSAYRYDGAAWHQVFTDTRQNLNGLWLLGSQVIAVGASGTVLRLAP